MLNRDSFAHFAKPEFVFRSFMIQEEQLEGIKRRFDRTVLADQSLRMDFGNGTETFEEMFFPKDHGVLKDLYREAI